jgi:hypothetical protein
MVSYNAIIHGLPRLHTECCEFELHPGQFFPWKKAALGLLYALPLPCGVIDIYMHGCVSVTE